jgi:hypothetical protein
MFDQMRRPQLAPAQPSPAREGIGAVRRPVVARSAAPDAMVGADPFARIAVGSVTAGVVQRQGAPPDPAQVAQVTTDLETLVDTATWSVMRDDLYKKESAASGSTGRAQARVAAGPGAPGDLPGVASVVDANKLAQAAKALQKQSPPATPEERAQKMFAAANQALTDAHVPLMKGFDLRDDLVSHGEFDPDHWRLEIQKAQMTAPMSDDLAAALAENTLHETRHCEQHFLAARFEGSQPGKLAADVVKDQGIPGDVAIEAVQREKLAGKGPKLAGAELTQAETMFNSLVTGRTAAQATSRDVSAQINQLEALNQDGRAKLAALKASATTQTLQDATAARDALAAQKAKVEAAYHKYRLIPHEADSHEAGDMALAAFKSLPP